MIDQRLSEGDHELDVPDSAFPGFMASTRVYFSAGYVFGASDDDMMIQPRPVAGPPVPTWLRKELKVLPQPSCRSSPLAKAPRVAERLVLEVEDIVEGTGRKEKREKKGKKEKSDKKKVSKRKEKQKHRQKRARDDG